MASLEVLSINDYGPVLSEYLRAHSEEGLYRASQLSKLLVEGGLGPEDIIALHCEELDKVIAEMAPRQQVLAIADANQFLLEVMIAYGVHFKTYLELRLTQREQDHLAELAREHEQLQDAERIGRQWEDILANIAHELRNPLTTVKAALQIVEMSLTSGKFDHLPSLLGNAQLALDRLSRLSADLVEASRGEPPPLSFAPVELSTVVGMACDWVSAAASEKQILLSTLPPSASVRVLADANALLSVVGNLLSNAIRYTPKGGTVEVRYGTAGDQAWLEISDDGIGIPAEDQQRIFDKFYRSNVAREAEPRGLGLGLALVKHLVEAHDGKVELESTPGKGSTFRVRLPRVADA